MRAFLTLLMSGTICSAAGFECRWTDTPPVIDGQADEAAWKNAQIIEDFRQPWADGNPAAKAATRARLLWDREFLYFAAEMEDHDLFADVREHDGALWNNDVFELFLRPSEKHAGYYEFEVNAAGAVFDAFFPAADSWKDPAQRGRDAFHVEAKVALRGTLNVRTDRDSGWTVEGRIPWRDFFACGGRPAPGETWRVNLARINFDAAEKNAAASTAAPLTKFSFHRTEEFAPLRFVGPAMERHTGWENTRLLGSPDGPAKYVARPAWQSLEKKSVITITPTPGGEWLWFIEQKLGWFEPMKLRRMRAGGDGSDAETLLELEDYTYSIAFHPRFAENGFVFLGVNGPRSMPPRTSRVLRFAVRDGRPDPGTRTVIIEWPSNGHNGGGLAFAADGALFLTSGDGTTTGDTDNVGQDTRSLRAKILRINVDETAAGKLYSVPRDNPFVGDARFAPETWAYGLRNPWRLTYDAASDQLWVGENGQDSWEIARLVRRGENYGWSRYEGGHDFLVTRAIGPQPVTPPTLEHPHSEFRSLTGGVVYRGKRLPELTGAYVYGDFGTGRVWAARHDGTRLEWQRELCDTALAITHVTADAEGEVLITDYGASPASGGVFRLEAAPPADPVPAFATRLSESGLFTDTAGLTPAPGVMPYEINASGWHDGATALHHAAFPAGGEIEIRPVKSWLPPDRTVLAQTLSRGGRRIETRVLVKAQGDWHGYTYVWNDAQTDAALAPKAGADLNAPADGGLRLPWRVPSRAECMMCHTRQTNFSLSLHDAQLNRGTQLVKWERLGLFKIDATGWENSRGTLERERDAQAKRPSPPPQATAQREPVPSPLLPRDPAGLFRFSAPNDAGASLDDRSRSYLGVNCAHCHQPDGGGNSQMDFDWLLPVAKLLAVGNRPVHGDLGLGADKLIIAPGDPGRSIVPVRMGIRGPGQMPPIGTRLPDPDGTRLLVEWIRSLKQ